MRYVPTGTSSLSLVFPSFSPPPLAADPTQRLAVERKGRSLGAIFLAGFPSRARPPLFFSPVRAVRLNSGGAQGVDAPAPLEPVFFPFFLPSAVSMS